MLRREGVQRMLVGLCIAAGGQLVWAKKHRISAQYVNDVLNGRREPGEKILAAMGLKRVVRYARED